MMTSKLFEMLCLEGAQAGLSWLTILRKRENYARPSMVSMPKKWPATAPPSAGVCCEDPGIVRNRLKVDAFIANAQGLP